MAKKKQSRIKKVEDQIFGLFQELQRIGQLLNITMNTLNEYIVFKKDLDKFEKYIKKTTKRREENAKNLKEETEINVKGLEKIVDKKEEE